MDYQRQIDEARRKFARSLVGCWSTVQGTFDAVMGQVWEIRPNGTGKFTDTGPFYSPRDETQFEWRQSQAFVFEMRVTGYPSDRESAEEGIEEVEDEWVSIRYDFISVQTDVGVVIGLITLSEAGDQITSFYGSMAPLSYAGTVE